TDRAILVLEDRSALIVLAPRRQRRGARADRERRGSVRSRGGGGRGKHPRTCTRGGEFGHRSRARSDRRSRGGRSRARRRHPGGLRVNSGSALAATVTGRRVDTIEGLGSLEHPDPLQVAFTEHYGAQCGFCTAGMLMAAKALLDRTAEPTREDVVDALSGNL